MTIQEVLQLQQERVHLRFRRACWPVRLFWFVTPDRAFKQKYGADSFPMLALLSPDDILATDWEVV